MEISIKEIKDSINEIFDDAQVLNVSTLYEKVNNSDNLKLIIYIHKLFKNDINLIYTKLVFLVNKEKTKLINNSFTYLYDLNCIWSQGINFDNIDDFEEKLNFIINKKRFGNDLKTLSDFMTSPTELIKEWFYKNRITNINLSYIKYEPKNLKMRCETLSFDFVLTINSDDYDLNIKKIDNDYIYSFDKNDNVIIENKPNLNTLIPTIGTIIKKEFNINE